MTEFEKKAFSMLQSFTDKWKAKFEEVPQPPLEGATKAYQTKDGQSVMIDKMEVGGMCTLSDGTPCPAGEVYLADGSTIYVDEMGKITNIESAQVETTEPTTEDMKKAVSQFAQGTPDERMARLELVAKALMNQAFGWEMREVEQKGLRDAAIATYSQFKEDFKETAKVIEQTKEVFTTQESKIQALENQLTEQGTMLKEMFDVLSNFSVEKPIEKPRNNFKEEKQSKVDELIARRLGANS